MSTQVITGSSVQSWILAARPKTLTASIVPILIGTATALNYSERAGPAWSEPFPWHLGLLALGCALLIQIGTNFINDALDFKRGADTSERLGPRRVVASGILDMETVWRAGIGCFIAAVALSIPLVISGGLPIVLIGTFSIISGYLYTGGPHPLAYSGLGEIFVIIFFGLVAVSGLHYLYCGTVTTESLIAGSQIGLLATLLIAINNFRDLYGDRRVNKLTLTARFGIKFGRGEVACCCLLPFIASLYWAFSGYIYSALLPFLSFSLAWGTMKDLMVEEPSAKLNQYLGKAALLHLTFGTLLSFGLIVDALN